MPSAFLRLNDLGFEDVEHLRYPRGAWWSSRRMSSSALSQVFASSTSSRVVPVAMIAARVPFSTWPMMSAISSAVAGLR